jgi:hypothetical protein
MEDAPVSSRRWLLAVLETEGADTVLDSSRSGWEYDDEDARPLQDPEDWEAVASPDEPLVRLEVAALARQASRDRSR